MNFRIEKKEAFRIIGVSIPLSEDIEENFKIVPKFWEDSRSEGAIEKLARLMNSVPMGVLGACVHEKDNMRYFIAVSNNDSTNHGFEEQEVPASTWAIFPGEGVMPTAIQTLTKSIHTDWLPTSGFEYANATEIEVYMNDDYQNSKFEVWISIVKKDK